MVVLHFLGWVGSMYFHLSRLGLVLGQIAEQGFVQSYIIGNAQENIIANYFAKPISIILVILILMGLFLPTLKKIYNKKRRNLNDQR